MGMKPKLMIEGAGNVVVPAFLTLQQRGYMVRREQRADGTQTWVAQNGAVELASDDPVTLLSLAAIAETRGEDWKASDAEIQRFLDEYGAA
jgi:hypothetical protein